MKKIIALVMAAGFALSVGSVSAAECDGYRTVRTSAVTRPYEVKNILGAMPIIYLPRTAPADWCSTPWSYVVYGVLGDVVEKVIR